MSTAYIQSLTLKNFRCFTSQSFTLDSPIVVIEGHNGSGKTSILEALYYTCYMRSFRCPSSRDLIHMDSEHFFISTTFCDHQVEIGVMLADRVTKKQVRVDQKNITSYKELRDFCRIISVTEDDLNLIKGSPEKRRSFIDQALFLTDHEMYDYLKIYQELLNNRNAYLSQRKMPLDEQQLLFWTRKLWDVSLLIQHKRILLLSVLSTKAMKFIHNFWPDAVLIFEYQSKIDDEQTFEQFKEKQADLFEREKQYKRSLFGIHLDDIEIKVDGKKARYFSSRGQQKLLVMALKMALVEHIHEVVGPTAFLLDDFATDLDPIVSDKLIELCIELKTQLFFITPLKGEFTSNALERHADISLKIQL